MTTSPIADRSTDLRVRRVQDDRQAGQQLYRRGAAPGDDATDIATGTACQLGCILVPDMFYAFADCHAVSVSQRNYWVKPEVVSKSRCDAQASDQYSSPMANDANAHDIGLEIKRLRTSQGLTLKRLAEMTDSHPSTWSQIETGSRKPSLPMLELAAKALNIHPGEFWPTAGPALTEQKSFDSITFEVRPDTTMLAKSHGIQPGDVLIFEYDPAPQKGEIVLYLQGENSSRALGIVGEHPLLDDDGWLWPVEPMAQPIPMTEIRLLGVATKMQRALR